jgi:hypothetical protein
MCSMLRDLTMCNCLSSDSTQKFLCFGGWSKRDLICTEQVAEAVKVMGDWARIELKHTAPVDDKEEGTSSKKARSD